jgi:hypothetical protein
MIVTNLAAPKVAAKLELLFNSQFYFRGYCHLALTFQDALYSVIIKCKSFNQLLSEEIILKSLQDDSFL